MPFTFTGTSHEETETYILDMQITAERFDVELRVKNAPPSEQATPWHVYGPAPDIAAAEVRANNAAASVMTAAAVSPPATTQPT